MTNYFLKRFCCWEDRSFSWRLSSLKVVLWGLTKSSFQMVLKTTDTLLQEQTAAPWPAPRNPKK